MFTATPPIRSVRLRLLSIIAILQLTTLAFAQDAQNAVDEKQIIATEAENTAPAAETPKATKPRVPTKQRLDQQKQQLLSELKGPPEAVWIKGSDQPVLGFWQADLTGKPIGAVLLLHDLGQNPRWRNTLLRFHEYLPHHGWATLSVELPTLPDPTVPQRPLPSAAPTGASAPDEAAAKADPKAPVDESQVVHKEEEPEQPEPAAQPEAAVPSTTVEDVRSVINQRIAAAMSYLHEQGQYNLVLLGEGASAIWALAHLSDAVVPEMPATDDQTQKAVMDRAVRAVILLDAQVPEALAASALIEQIKHPQVPTLDVYTNFSRATQQAAEKRKQVATKAGYESYVLRRLPPQTGTAPEATETLLTKTIRGFLHQHARGVELK